MMEVRGHQSFPRGRNGYRNPALLAKIASTIDVMSVTAVAG
jgi:hypothetical protein